MPICALNTSLLHIIGDLHYHRTQAQNIASGGPPDLTGGIIRVTQEGKPAPNGPLGVAFTEIGNNFVYLRGLHFPVSFLYMYQI